MFASCQNCRIRPASLLCKTCEDLPKLSKLCFHCDATVHQQLLATPHHKQYIRAELPKFGKIQEASTVRLSVQQTKGVPSASPPRTSPAKSERRTVAKREVGVQTKPQNLGRKIEKVRELIEAEEQKHRRVVEYLLSTMTLVKQCEDCSFELNRCEEQRPLRLH